jgi:ABC-type transport system substrate-binding protein
MNFLSPIPWEIDKYHHINGNTKGSLLNNSIGTGPYMLLDSKSKQQIVLQKNPNYRKEFYDFQNGKKQVPVVDKFYFIVEKENIPRWNKFLQGYADLSTIPSESFQNTIQITKRGHFDLSNTFKEKNIHLDIEPASYISGIVFNFLDPVVGQYSSKQIKLRQAISIAFDFDEYRTIFRNGRGELAHDPIPPAVIPNKYTLLGNNQYVFPKNKKKSLDHAKRLLKEAGYPNGINPKTKKPLVLYLDQISSGLPEEKALFNWFQKQTEKIGIKLHIRDSDNNRYRKKLLNGNFQMTFFIWSADYPTAENFLMLFYGPNQHAGLEGPNWANFNSKEYNKLYRMIERMPEGRQKNTIFKKMIDILREQSVWIWGLYGESFYLLHDWTDAYFMKDFSSGILKYYQIDTNKRTKSWNRWNRPDFLPIWIVLLLTVLLISPFLFEKSRINHTKAKRSPF